MNELVCSNLSYKNLLKDINISFRKNTINYISGSNKSSKTTFIRALCGIIGTEKSVFYKDKDISSFSSQYLVMSIGRVINSNTIEFNFSNIDQVLQYRLDQIGTDINQKKNMRNLIKKFSLNNYMEEDINSLDYLIKVKVLIIRELLSSPSVLILDNVLDSVDYENAKQIIMLLKEIDDLTVIISSNNLELSIFSDYLYILDGGCIVLEGKTLDVLKEDSFLNKLGLELPFMVDLSIKLKYYNLLDDIELDMSRMVDNLWK